MLKCRMNSDDVIIFDYIYCLIICVDKFIYNRVLVRIVYNDYIDVLVNYCMMEEIKG